MSAPRGTSLSPPDRFLLEQWGRQLYEAFGEHAYLVGSVARAENGWRDVDVRLMLDTLDWPPPMLRALNLAVSLWGRRVTGLPIDFQFQQVDEANAEHPGVRGALGILPDIWAAPVSTEVLDD